MLSLFPMLRCFQRVRSGKCRSSKLRCAAEAGDVQEVKRLLRCGAQVNERDIDTLTSAAHWAALNCHTDTLRVLLEAGADPNAPNEDNNTPLHWASLGGSSDAIKLLLSAGASVNQPGDLGFTPLHAAAAEGNADACRTLAKAGADRNACSTVGDSGTDVKKSSGSALTPLHLAIAENHVEVVEALLEYGATITAAHQMLASKQGNKRIMVQLRVEERRPSPPNTPPQSEPDGTVDSTRERGDDDRDQRMHSSGTGGTSTANQSSDGSPKNNKAGAKWRGRHETLLQGLRPRLLAADATSVTIGWGGLEGATAYQAEIATGHLNAPWMSIGEVRGTRLRKKNLVRGTRYAFRIRAHVSSEQDDHEWTPWGPASATITVSPSKGEHSGQAHGDRSYDSDRAGSHYSSADPYGRCKSYKHNRSQGSASFGGDTGAGDGQGHNKGDDGGINRETLSSALDDIRKEVRAIRMAPASERKSRVRQLQLRFHPDKALPSLKPLFEEITKEINVLTSNILV